MIGSIKNKNRKKRISKRNQKDDEQSLQNKCVQCMASDRDVKENDFKLEQNIDFDVIDLSSGIKPQGHLHF